MIREIIANIDNNIKFSAKNQEDISEEDKSIIFTEFRADLEKVKSWGEEINIDEIMKKVRNVSLYKGQLNQIMKIHGFYSSDDNYIIYDNKTIDTFKKSRKGMSTIIHELIHGATGEENFKNEKDKNNIGMIEGATENLTGRLYYKDEGQKMFWPANKNNNYKQRLIININHETSYPLIVSIVRQMEYMMNEKSYKSILDGSMKFFEKFEKNYGIELSLLLNAGVNRILENNFFNSSILEYYDNLQDMILVGTFNKEFENVNSIENANKFLNKLANFETIRGRLDRYNGKEFERDTTFQNFYKMKLEDIKKVLESKNIDKSDINNLIKNNQYSPKEYLPEMTQNEKENLSDSGVAQAIAADMVVHDLKQVNYDDYKKYIFMGDGVSIYQVITKGEKIIESYNYENVEDTMKEASQPYATRIDDKYYMFIPRKDGKIIRIDLQEAPLIYHSNKKDFFEKIIKPSMRIYTKKHESGIELNKITKSIGLNKIENIKNAILKSKNENVAKNEEAFMRKSEKEFKKESDDFRKKLKVVSEKEDDKKLIAQLSKNKELATQSNKTIDENLKIELTK